MNNIGTSFKILDAASEWFLADKLDSLIPTVAAAPTNHRKPTNLKLCPVIIDTLKRIYTQDNI